jgi:hypothetical protein
MVNEGERKLSQKPLFIVPLVAEALENLGGKTVGKQEYGESKKWEEESSGNRL